MQYGWGFLLCLVLLAGQIVSVLPSSTGAESPVSVYQQSTSSTPYMATFQLAKNSSDPMPWVLYPQNDRTVWVITIRNGDPFYSQLVNFTLDRQPQVVLTLPNAEPASIVVDDKSGRIWFPVNDSVAYYDLATKKREDSITYHGGRPEFVTLDSFGRVWTTLVNSNQIAVFNPTSFENRTFKVPTPNAILQGITVAPDGTVWFAEAQAKKLGKLDPATGAILEYSSPDLVAPAQVAVDSNGILWFTDHGTNEFGNFNPVTGGWRRFPIGYCPDSTCETGLPNAIALDIHGKVWFSEHFSGRVARYDPETGLLTEYVVPYPLGIPVDTVPGTWWSQPGPGNLVWFTSVGFGVIGYLNASVPVPLTIATNNEASVQRGWSVKVRITLAYNGTGTVKVGVSPSYLDYNANRPLISGNTLVNVLVNSNPSALDVTINAAWTASTGPRYVTITASDGQVSTGIPVKIIVVDNLLLYTSLAIWVAVVIGGSAFALYVRHRRRREKNPTYTKTTANSMDLYHHDVTTKHVPRSRCLNKAKDSQPLEENSFRHFLGVLSPFTMQRTDWPIYVA